MSTAWAESLLHRFAVPLVSGDQVHVGAPLGTRGAVRLAAAVADGLDKTEAGQSLQGGRQMLLRPLGGQHRVSPLSDDDGAALILVALHDLLFLLHPEASKLKPEGRKAALHVAQRLLERAALSADDADVETLYARHSLLGQLFQLSRDDIHRPGRDGVQVFKGTTAPRRWLSSDDEDDEVHHVAVLPELGRVESGLGTAALRALFFTSPLTDLYHPLRSSGLPPVELFAQAGWLRHHEVARLLTRRYLELDLHRVGPNLVATLFAGEKRPPKRAVAAWLCLLSHLQLVAHVTVETTMPAATAESATLDFYALYAAVYAARPELAAPPDAMSDPPLRSAIARHVERCQKLVGPSRLQKWTDLVAL